jgi:hypothetical protein
MSNDIDISLVPLAPQQTGDQLIAVRNGAIVRAESPDLSLPGLGAASAAQGLLAETAVQPDALLNFETSDQLDARDTVSRDRGNHTNTQPPSTIEGFAAAAAAAAPVQSVAGKGGAVTLTKGDVGLEAVDNTSDAAKPISTATQAALDLRAPLTVVQGTLTYASTVNLDMAALVGRHQTIALTGNLTLTSSNRATGRTVALRIICDATLRNLTFPAGWIFLGTKPSDIAASKIGVLSLTFFGANDTDCVAAWGVQA